MARQRKKLCLYCYQPFAGRSDAKTCSDRCRKGLQRARSLYQEIAPDDEHKSVATRRYAVAAVRRDYYAGQ